MIFTVLSAIGSVLLIVLIVVAIIVALILLFPIGYKIKIEKKDNFKFNGKVSWLFEAVRFTFWLENNKIQWQLRIIGIPVISSLKKKKEAKPEYKKAKKQPTIKPGEKTEAYDQLKAETKKANENGFGESDYDYNDGRIRKIDDDSAFEEESKPTFTEKIKAKISSITEKKAVLAEYKEMLVRIWPDLSRLLKHVLMKRVEGYINFGFDDPATTGMALGVVGALCVPIPETLEVNPNFEEAEFECDIDMKGRIVVLYVLICVVKLIKDPKIKELLGKKFPALNKKKKKSSCSKKKNRKDAERGHNVSEKNGSSVDERENRDGR